ncbi:MAG: YdbL family protein [Gammaproteobacteria bacterium]|nr:YdbL family protein [Gammaproteobacteria bacterium]
MTQLQRLIVGLLGLSLMACVTVNIYFPAAAAEQAADKIIKDVYGTEPGDVPESPSVPTMDKSSALMAPSDTHALSALASLDFLLPAAHAAEADLSISTPGIRKLTAAMEQRHKELQPYYDNGAIGMTRDALIAVRDPMAIPVKERNKVKQLVADEDGDRNNLYAEIAKANGHPEWENDIRGTFAKRWVANAPSGWWYQDSAGTWKQK